MALLVSCQHSINRTHLCDRLSGLVPKDVCLKDRLNHLVKTNCTGPFMMPQTFGTNFLLKSDVPIPLRCLGEN